jgi:uncharacterized tellurite resistance protein B-like protein
MPEWNMDAIKGIAHVLVGAAHADGTAQMEEEAMILQLLADLLDADELPEELVQHLGRFDPESFDLEATCKGLGLDTKEQRRALLEAVAQVTEVDEVHDLDETHYIVKVARAIGAEPDEYENLTVDVTHGEDEAPPPVPRG